MFGIILLIGGIPLIIIGAVAIFDLSYNFFSLSIEEESQLAATGFGFLVLGVFMAFIGFFLLMIAHQRNIARYVVEETGMTLGGASGRALDGYGRVISKGTEAIASGLNKGGGIKLNVDGNQGQKIVVKCRSCGTLNDEDATFCDKCGEKL